MDIVSGSASWLLERLKLPLNLGCDAQLCAIGGNQTHPVYLLRHHKKRYAVKIFNNINLSSTSRLTQFKQQTLLAEQTLAPEPVWLSPDQKIWVETWVDTKTQTDSEQWPHNIAQALAQIHATSVSLQHLDIVESWRRYISLACLSSTDALVIQSKELTAHEMKLNAMLSEDDRVLCHNDLASNHIVSLSPVCVLDWEYAAIASRYFDLASACLVNDMNSAHVSLMLSTYSDLCGLNEEWVKERVKNYLPSVQLTQQLWHSAFHALSKKS